MPDPVAATPIAPPAAGAPTPTSAALAAPINPDNRLPGGFKLNTSLRDDIDKFFDETPAELKVETAAVVPKVEPKEEPTAGSVAARLAAKNKPAPATPLGKVAETAPVMTSTEEAVAKVEAEMRAHNPKWKPADGWTVLKTSLKTESERRASLERELTETKQRLASPVVAGVTAEEIESLKAREKASSDRLLVMDLENHPSFKAQFVVPKEAEIAAAQELLTANKITVDVRTLLGKPRAELGKAVVDAIKDLPEFDRVEVAEHIRKAYSIEQNAKAALTQSKDLGAALQAKSVDRQRVAFANRWAPVSAAIGEFVQPIESPAEATPEQRAADEAYNADLASLRTKAEAIALSPTSDEAIAENSIKAAAYDLHIRRVLPRVVSEYEGVVNINRKLVAELNALRGRNPNLRMNGLPAGGDSPATDPAKMDHVQAADHFFKS